MEEFRELTLKERLLNIWYTKKKYLIIVLFIIVLSIISLIVIFNKKDSNVNRFSSIESIMIYNAKKYVVNNKINNNLYIPLNYLNIKIDNKLNCNTNSGVLLNNDTYIPYLMCENYNSSEIQRILNENQLNKEYGVLLGSNPYVLTDNVYNEVGINIGNGYTVSIENENIDNGVSIVQYNILKNDQYITALKRIVIAENIIGASPVIELVGNTTRTLNINTPYVETGYTATDALDGNITDKVIIGGTVDTEKSGTYTITYKVTNSRNNSTIKKRKIIVNDNNVNLTITSNISKIINNSITISLSILGNGYSHTLLPNGETLTSTNPTYTVYKNGTYEFTIYDTNNNSEIKSVSIKELDTTAPVVTCSAEVDHSSSLILVNAADPEGISKYNYYYDNKASGPILVNHYEVQQKLTSAKVSVSDISGNVTTKNCEIIDVTQEFTPGLFLRHFEDKFGYALYIPNGIKVNKKNTLVVFLHGAGEVYKNLNQMPSADLLKNTLKGKTYNSIIIAPHSGRAWIEHADNIISLINSITKEFNIDSNKIALTGFSFGSKGVWAVAAKYPNTFSCLVPIACGVDCGVGKIADTAKFAETFKDIPIRAFVGEHDANVKSMGNIRDVLVGVNPNYSLTIVPNAPHQITDYVYNDTDTFDWMTKQTLESRK